MGKKKHPKTGYRGPVADKVAETIRAPRVDAMVERMSKGLNLWSGEESSEAAEHELMDHRLRNRLVRLLSRVIVLGRCRPRVPTQALAALQARCSMS